MKGIKSILATAILGSSLLLTLPSSTDIVGKASAQERYQGRGYIRVDQDRYTHRNRYRIRHRQRHYPRIIIIIDRDYPGNIIIIGNRFTGPYSYNVNQVRVYVRHSDFLRLRRAYRINNNISVNVNTGRNVVTFNTVVGNFSTGDVNINL